MPVPSQGHCGFPSFPVVDWFCLFIDLCTLHTKTVPRSTLLHANKTTTKCIQFLNIYLRNIWNCWTGYTIYAGLGQFTLINRETVYEKRKLTQTRLYITCSTISYILYNLIFTTKLNDSSILITSIACDYLNLTLADEHVGDVTIPIQVIKYNHFFSRRISQLDCSIHIKLNYFLLQTRNATFREGDAGLCG